MKSRLGFVSNSSSSSFILKKNEEYQCVQDLALRMLEIRNEEWLTEENEEEVEFNQIIKQDVTLAKNLAADENVCFNTCNYETYIADEGDYLLVSTCNNHDWSEFYNFLSVQDLPPAVQTKLSTGDYPEYAIENISEHYDFTYLRSGKQGHPAEEMQYCNLCYDSVWKLTDGRFLCPSCGKTPEQINYSKNLQRLFTQFLEKVSEREGVKTYNWSEVKYAKGTLTFDEQKDRLILKENSKTTEDIEYIRNFIEKY